MPTYAYACRDCGHRFDQYQSFSEDSLVTCPACAHDALRKVYDSVGVSFRGPGFYSTDSRSSGSATTSASASTDSSSSGASSSSSSGSSSSSSASSAGSTQSTPKAAAGAS